MKDAEIKMLKGRLADVEAGRDSLKVELAKVKKKNNGIHQDILKLLQSKNQ